MDGLDNTSDCSVACMTYLDCHGLEVVPQNGFVVYHALVYAGEVPIETSVEGLCTDIHVHTQSTHARTRTNKSAANLARQAVSGWVAKDGSPATSIQHKYIPN